MLTYAILLVIHIICAVVWLGIFPADLLLRKSIRENKQKSDVNVLISIWLKLINLGGMIGLTGLLITGIILSIILGYGFFQFASGANHWLYTKQVIMILLLLITFVFIIPTAKKVRVKLNDDLKNNSTSEPNTKQSMTEESEVEQNLNKLFNLSTLVNIFVLINFLLAITKRFL